MTSAFQVKYRGTPKVLNSKAQGKPKRRQPRGATLGTRVQNIIRTPTGFHMFGGTSRVPCKTPLGFEFVSFRYPGCGRRGDRPWAVECNAFGVRNTEISNTSAV